MPKLKPVKVVWRRLPRTHSMGPGFVAMLPEEPGSTSDDTVCLAYFLPAVGIPGARQVHVLAVNYERLKANGYPCTKAGGGTVPTWAAAELARILAERGEVPVPKGFVYENRAIVKRRAAIKARQPRAREVAAALHTASARTEFAARFNSALARVAPPGPSSGNARCNFCDGPVPCACPPPLEDGRQKEGK